MHSIDRQDKILSVDDNESNRYAIKKILEREGYEVIQAATGEEALSAMTLLPDLIILDVNLPDISGFEICRRIKEDRSYFFTPILHVSASFIQSSHKVIGLESGADGYLAQPIDAAVLIATVKSLLRIRRAEREKAKLIEELKAEREMREQFVATLSHDLRSPLSAAKMATQLLARNKQLSEKDHVLLNRIVKNLNRTDLMIQDLLDASLLRVGGKLPVNPSEVDLAQLCLHASEEIRVSHPAGIVYQGPEQLKGCFDESHLKRLLDNLINNAVKYGDAQAPITLTLSEPEPTWAKISVHNFGNPIAPAEVETLFDQFKRTESAKSSGKLGWGLGLAFVRGAAEAHEGSVVVKSSAEAGTDFTVNLKSQSVADSDHTVA